MGLEVNLGTSDEGMAPDAIEPEATPAEAIQPDDNSETNDEKVLTSDIDKESEQIVQPPKKVKVVEKKVTPIVKPQPVKKVEKKVEPDKPVVAEQPKINQRALFKKSTVDGTGNKPGDQGSVNGTSQGSNLYVGSGSGKGTGSGTGTGGGTGAGISYSLDGRNPQYLPIPEYNNQAEGKVVVKVIVNKEGQVISATPGVKGSTTLDDYLLSVAKNAALKARFSRNPDAPDHQEGTITYKFILQ